MRFVAEERDYFASYLALFVERIFRGKGMFLRSWGRGGGKLAEE